MYYLDFLNEFHSYKAICDGNSSTIVEMSGGEFELKDYHAATQGRLRDQEKLNDLMQLIRLFVSRSVVAATSEPNIQNMIASQRSMEVA